MFYLIKNELKSFRTWGFLYGGSSKINDEGIPLSIVLERILDTANVRKIPNKINSKTHIVDTKEEIELAKKLPIKIVAIVIKKGNLPITWNKVIS